MAVEMGVGVLAAKRLESKVVALLMPKTFAPALVSVRQVESLAKKDQNLSACLQKFDQSSLPCQTDELNAAEKNTLVTAMIAVTFKPKAAPWIAPFILPSSTGN